jgi:hypothetical protein
MPVKAKRLHYLYKTTCNITGKYYVGIHSTNNLDDGYLGSGKRLRSSLKKHGRECHKKEILEYFKDRRSLLSSEKQIITNEMRNDPKCMNISPGGGGGFKDADHQLSCCTAGGKVGGIAAAKSRKKRFSEDAEFRKAYSKIMSESHIGQQQFLGKTHSAESRAKISRSVSKKQKGNLNSQFGTAWVNDGFKAVKIKADALEEYLSNGYSRGRKLKLV